jgi:hypothetical protein
MSSIPYTSLLPQRSSRRYTLLVIVLGISLAFVGTLLLQAELPLSVNALVGERYCTSNELSVGRWEQHEVLPFTWPRLKHSAGYTCSDDRYMLRCSLEDPSQLARLAAAISWRWKPHGCALRQFNPNKLAHRLGRNLRNGRKGSGILFVGDSLTLQHAQSFECLAGLSIDSGFLMDSLDYTSSNSFVLSGGATIEYVRWVAERKRTSDSAF